MSKKSQQSSQVKHMKNKEEIKKKWKDNDDKWSNLDEFQEIIDKLIKPYEEKEEKEKLQKYIEEKIIPFLKEKERFKDYLNDPIFRSKEYLYLEFKLFISKAFEFKNVSTERDKYLDYAIKYAEMGVIYGLTRMDAYKEQIEFINAFKESITTN